MRCPHCGKKIKRLLLTFETLVDCKVEEKDGLLNLVKIDEDLQDEPVRFQCWECDEDIEVSIGEIC
ncbi:MAG: hypothetical protein M0R06_16235 [Sphaerochaeta sp.]|jgi:hypothetical protein|nr:hypothetical protein [Sphaerochaeta sp.]